MIHYTEFNMETLIKNGLKKQDSLTTINDKEEDNTSDTSSEEEMAFEEDTAFGEIITFGEFIEDIKYKIIVAIALRYFCCIVYDLICN